MIGIGIGIGIAVVVAFIFIAAGSEEDASRLRVAQAKREVDEVIAYARDRMGDVTSSKGEKKPGGRLGSGERVRLQNPRLARTNIIENPPLTDWEDWQ